MAKADKVLEQAKEHLDAGESVEAVVHGTYEVKRMGQDSVRKGIFLATDRRLVFYAKKMGGYDLESFSYDKVSSFEQSKSMMGHSVSFHASGNKVSMKWIDKGDDLEGFVASTKRHLAGNTANVQDATSPAAASGSDEVMNQIRQLGELREAGILTEEEFSSKKAELLARL